MAVLAGRYNLEETLGNGGMARVVAATDEVLGRRVAVKLVHASLAEDPVVRQRLLREARAAASFSHPNAVAVFDTGDDDGLPYVVMELIDGPTLTEVLLERGKLTPPEAVAIADDVLAALGAAHDRGLVHRDVKPGNVLMPPGGGAKLADFGIAKGLQGASQRLTATGTVIGTPRYISPEQVAGGDVTSQADIYSVGVLLYELLSGNAPFTEGSAVAVALAHQRDPVPALSETAPDVSDELAAVVHRALEKDPSHRFEDAEQMRAALAASVSERPLTLPLAATPMTDAEPGVMTGGRASRTGARSRGVLVAVAAVVLVLVAFAGFTFAQGDRPAGVPAADLAPSAPQATLSPSVTPEAAPTSDPPDDPTASPTRQAATPEELIAVLAADPGAVGGAGQDLLEELRDLLEEEEADERAEDARDLIGEIEEWVADGELTPDAAALTVSLLEPLAEADNDDDNEDDDDEEDRRRGRRDNDD